MIKPLKPPVIPARFPIELLSTIKPKGLLQQIKYRWFVSPFMYVFTEDYVIELENEITLTITKGFELDLSSVPPFLWKWLPPIREKSGDGMIAHDWTYAKDVFRDLMGWFLNKIWCDWVMLKKERGNAPKYDYWSRFLGVLIFGWGVYFRRAKEQQEKENK